MILRITLEQYFIIIKYVILLSWKFSAHWSFLVAFTGDFYLFSWQSCIVFKAWFSTQSLFVCSSADNILMKALRSQPAAMGNRSVRPLKVFSSTSATKTSRRRRSAVHCNATMQRYPCNVSLAKTVYIYMSLVSSRCRRTFGQIQVEINCGTHWNWTEFISLEVFFRFSSVRIILSVMIFAEA